MTTRPVSGPTERSMPPARSDHLLAQAHEDEGAREQQHPLDVEVGEEAIVDRCPYRRQQPR